MRNIQWCISPGAVLLFALAYFFDNSGVISTIVPAVLAHEAGHCIALWLGGMRIRRFTLGLFGLEIDYHGRLRGPVGICAALSGPLSGLIYAFALSGADSEFWRLSAAASFMLSCFNLLPILPLDGGRLLVLAAGERALPISRVISLVFAAAGLYLWLTRGWVSVFAMGLWLAWWNFRSVCK